MEDEDGSLTLLPVAVAPEPSPVGGVGGTDDDEEETFGGMATGVGCGNCPEGGWLKDLMLLKFTFGCDSLYPSWKAQ